MQRLKQSDKLGCSVHCEQQFLDLQARVMQSEAMCTRLCPVQGHFSGGCSRRQFLRGFCFLLFQFTTQPEMGEQ